MTNEAAENRREHKRIIVSAPAVVQTGDEEFSGKILNISAGGAGISMDVQLKDDSRITVNIEDLGMIPARVVRKLQNGVAVKFEISEEKEKRFIQQVTEIVEMKRGQQAQKLA